LGAYLSLSLGARCLLVELKALYTGNNNGRLFMSGASGARLNRPKWQEPEPASV